MWSIWPKQGQDRTGVAGEGGHEAYSLSATVISRNAVVAPNVLHLHLHDLIPKPEHASLIKKF